MIAAMSGGAGDIIYSIPVARALGVTTYAVKVNYYMQPHGSMFQALANLLTAEGFNIIPTSGNYPVNYFEPSLIYQFNFDLFREMPNRATTHIIKNIAKRFNAVLPDPWNAAFLRGVTAAANMPDNLIHLTPRWRDGSKVNWAKVLHEMQGTKGFIGFQHEWVDFCSRYGSIEWINTNDLLELAECVAGAKRLYCNQSCALAIAQGLGKEYHLEKKPNKTNVLFYTKNEYLL